MMPAESAAAPLCLNLGCGSNKIDGYVNVDRDGDPDVRHDLETFPWPWETGSVSSVLMSHVLEHLAPDVPTYRRLWQELYRVCAPDARVEIRCPHPRHDNFLDDPTHIRAVTPRQFTLFSQRFNAECARNGWANSPLGMHWGIDFEIETVELTPSKLWLDAHPGQEGNASRLAFDAAVKPNQIEEFCVVLRVVKP